MTHHPHIRRRLGVIISILSAALTAMMVLGVALSLSLPGDLPYGN